MSNINDLDFAADFLNVYDNKGILDKFNKDTQKMETSSEVYSLVQKARKLLPKRIDGPEADKLNREKPVALVDDQIANSPRIADGRKRFARHMAANGGAQGLLAKLADAKASGDSDKEALIMDDILELAAAMKGDEDVFSNYL